MLNALMSARPEMLVHPCHKVLHRDRSHSHALLEDEPLALRWLRVYFLRRRARV